MTTNPLLSPQDALVALMVAASASNEDIQTSELVKITQIINHLPIFAAFDADRVASLTRVVFDLFEEEDGLDTLFGLLREALPSELSETAYALSCDVVAADGKLDEPELRFLEEVRFELNIDRLNAAAIERGARARHMTLG